MAQFQLNPGLDIDAFAAIYARDGMVQVPEVFSAATASLIAEEMEQRTPWRLTISAEDGKPGVLTKAQMAEYGRDNLQRALRDNQRLASEGFAYTYLAYLMEAPKDEAGGVSPLLHDFAAWLTSETFRAFGARLIGLPQVDKVDSKATLFRPGDFLTLHDDTAPTRRAAYTLGFSRQWRGDWGGQLLMHDTRTREITRGFAPRFNTLNLFRTPQWHSVAQVATYAAAPRLSVVGWLKTEAEIA
jgi:SM-20-related protein